MKLPYFGAVRAMNSVCNSLYSISLSTGFYQFQNTFRLFRHICILKFRETVFAVSAVISSVFTEIPQNIFPQAFVGKTIECHFPQPFKVSFPNQFHVFPVKFLVFHLLVNKKFIRLHILSGIVQHSRISLLYQTTVDFFHIFPGIAINNTAFFPVFIQII